MKSSLQTLIREYADGEITPARMEELERALSADETAREQFLHELNIHSALEDVAAGVENPVGVAANNVSTEPPKNWMRWPRAIATLAVAVTAVAVMFGVLLFRPVAGEPKIAKITGVSGSLVWTGDGGRIERDLTVGTELSGGTIEGVAPDSWFELEFNDGSKVVISGDSMLTFSDHGQKNLRLQSGSFSAQVVPQPAGKPMLVQTRSALLEVVGTQFEVQAGVSSTVLNVTEGAVRMKRLSDGNTIDVPAKHRAVAEAERELSAIPVPDAVHDWESSLDRGPWHTYGKWSPRTDGAFAKLKAIPYTTDDGRTIYAAGVGVSVGDSPAVVLQSNSRLRVRGRLASSHYVFFGLTVRHKNGDFAGKFQTILPAKKFRGGDEFEVLLSLDDYQLDPSLNHVREKLPDDPFDLVIESFWCHSLYDPVGLEVTSFELIPPDQSANN